MNAPPLLFLLLLGAAGNKSSHVGAAPHGDNCPRYRPGKHYIEEYMLCVNAHAAAVVSGAAFRTFISGRRACYESGGVSYFEGVEVGTHTRQQDARFRCVVFEVNYTFTIHHHMYVMFFLEKPPTTPDRSSSRSRDSSSTSFDNTNIPWLCVGDWSPLDHRVAEPSTFGQMQHHQWKL